MNHNYDTYQDAFQEYLRSLAMTHFSLEVWANTPEKRQEVEGKIGTLKSALELGRLMYDSVTEQPIVPVARHKQSV